MKFCTAVKVERSCKLAEIIIKEDFTENENLKFCTKTTQLGFLFYWNKIFFFITTQ